MAMVVRSNLMAYNANRQLGMNNSAVSKNLEKLSSGFKINRAADDAAGLAISEKMKAQIKGLETASANSQDGISLVQTAEGALTEVHDMLNRMTELATKSANGTIKNEVDREAIQNEVNKLNEEIDRISQSTNFNGINLLDGSLSTSGAGGKTSQVDSFKVEGKNAPVVDVAATNGKFVATAVTDLSGANEAKDGAVIRYGLTFEDGSTVNIELTVDNENGALVGADGKTYGTITKDSGKVTQQELGNALVAAFKETKVGEEYKITTSATGALTFEAKEAGSSYSKIIGITHSHKNKTDTKFTAVSVSATETVGIDAHQTLDVATLGNGGKNFGEDADKLEDFVFTVNGKKFVVVGEDTTKDKLDKIGSDITIIRSTADSATAAGGSDAIAVADAINKELGVSVSGSTTTGLVTLIDEGVTANNQVSGGLTLQIGDTGEDFNQVTVSVDNMSAKGIGTQGLDVSKQETAKAAIETIKTAINKVSTNRSEMGALQNRLEHTINNLDVAAENMTNANSRIRDTDMAKQMMEYTKMNVLTQSAQAMLAQANQNPQSILQLLQ